MSVPEILRVESLTAHAGGPALVGGVSFSLREGETFAMLGASGSGKSLTGRAIIGLPPRGIRYGGKVLFEGADLLAMGEKARTALRGQALAMVFQEPATALNPVMRIGAQIAEPLRIHTSLTSAERSARVADLLDRTGLAAAGVGPARYPHELSGGQRQRVAVAIALALSPRVVVADEPTSALDTVAAAQVLDLLFALTGDAGAALVLITHDTNVARRASRIAVMDGGKIVEEGGAAVVTTPRTAPAQAIAAGNRIVLPPRDAGSGTTVLSATGMTVRRGGRVVVDDAALDVAGGKRLAVVGRSGSGKTSLMRAILGLLSAEGTIMLDGEPVPPGAPSIRRAVSMVFQDPATSFNPRHTVARIVTEPLHRLPLRAAEKRARAEAILRRVGLPDALERRPHAFSGGQRQRIAIARALIAEPRVLIADEAVSALDAALRADIIRLLDDLTRRQNIALIFIAHDLSLVRTLADYIVVMEQGRVVEHASADAIFHSPSSEAARSLLAATDRHEFVKQGRDKTAEVALESDSRLEQKT
ncbi:ABC transporter ATP-binding protein [Acuticoccus sp. MNP-M23]|uniref:ABC transporter ATP-binding protein n=1 Tax=Acuticoccus sp. MNP-M23 TaxID=3072793 RepID=UPI002814C184|nr:ABC transporter ATP-binding protein [Acuticoccus sp. MNP-M23]WMS40807.1 ABC transporter ATP-binding protein [Acuticoccus sp. MNP-M23]